MKGPNSIRSKKASDALSLRNIPKINSTRTNKVERTNKKYRSGVNEFPSQSPFLAKSARKKKQGKKERSRISHRRGEESSRKGNHGSSKYSSLDKVSRLGKNNKTGRLGDNLDPKTKELSNIVHNSPKNGMARTGVVKTSLGFSTLKVQRIGQGKYDKNGMERASSVGTNSRTSSSGSTDRNSDSRSRPPEPIEYFEQRKNSIEFFQKLKKDKNIRFRTKFMNKKLQKMRLRSLNQNQNQHLASQESNGFRISKGFKPRSKRSPNSRKSKIDRMMSLENPYLNPDMKNSIKESLALRRSCRTKRKIDFYESQLNLICGNGKSKKRKIKNLDTVKGINSLNPYQKISSKSGLKLKKACYFVKAGSKSCLKLRNERRRFSTKKFKKIQRRVTTASNSKSTAKMGDTGSSAQSKGLSAAGLSKSRVLKAELGNRLLRRDPSLEPYLQGY